jgi:hypothetical protein
LPTYCLSISTQYQINAGFIIHFCRIFATTPHHPFLSHLWDNYSSFRLFPSAAFLPPLYIYPAGACVSVCTLSGAAGLTVKSLQFAAKNRKKALLFAYMEKKLYLCTIFLGLTDANET